MSTEVIVTKGGTVATLTFKSANGLHVLSRPTLHALASALDALSSDPELRALVITGSGDRAFSAGADLRELLALDHEKASEYAEFGQGIAQTIGRFPVPTIAALGAPAFGGGIELALACDFRLMASGARLHYQASQLGLLPGWGGTQRLPALVGRSRAKAMMIMCRPVSAEEALAWGLADDVGDDVAALVADWTSRLASLEPHATVQIKRALDLGFRGDFQGEREAFAACFAGDQTHRLIRAFLDRKSNTPSAQDL